MAYQTESEVEPALTSLQRQVFEHFINQCQKKYTRKYSLTENEQLMPLKSHCSFLTLMPNSPISMVSSFGSWLIWKQSISQTLMFILELKKKISVVLLLLLNSWLSIFAKMSKERVTT